MRIGLMSLAHTHAMSYASALGSTPGVEVVASDPFHAERPDGEVGGASFAADLGVGYREGYDELLAEVDAVIVCSENVRHREDVERAAAAGVHVLCEKPLATSAADAAAMASACREAGVVLMVAFPVRYSPEAIALATSVEAGALGDIVSFTGTNNGKLPAARSWFADPALAGGGALTDHVVHLADIMDLLRGGALPESVYAVEGRALHPGTAVETEGMVSLRYPDGVIATIDCSWSRPDGYPVWGGLTLLTVGSSGTMSIAPFEQRVDGFSSARGEQLWMPFGENADARMIAAFLGAITGGDAAYPDGATGIRTSAVVEAAYASVRSGQPVMPRLS
ncbi:Gfo/Idh/MocA family oxidoreductase [Microbacterium betulae]|uniref:Gfo/Idh/MocA family oxidoreductase n=1 Tax=Microbacterium betulae TaxID=2981139 RepID=A0AA97FKK2_9MICO|nr:Gfo/Idh/MocA family oxidoreductase [Microbacterium sp. AB]WOF23182.1 Gfo/Idh/MocA family oxidoreductase [Microbacterium sp. AB]